LFGGSDFNNAKGYYLEFGARLEIQSKRSPQNRFYIGLDINNRWVERELNVFNTGNFFTVRETQTVNTTEFNIQVPIGYTLRTNEGFYLNTGLELSTEKLFPAIHLGLGIAFGR
jgi:hypothetical protein